MKISWSWLQDYITAPAPLEQVAHRLTLAGLEVEGIHPYEQVRGSLAGVVVGRVLTVAPHPNADRLRVTTVDVGAAEAAHIVCGAPNVAVGQTVLVALPGTTIYPTVGEPLTLKEAKIRGERSQGMICADDELGLGTSHDGIRVLEKEFTPGTPAAEALGLVHDQVIEIGLTPNRTDALSHVGVARDLAAIYRTEHRTPSAAIVASGPCPVQVKVESPTACPRYSARVVRGVKVGPSPDWLRHRLQAIGQRSINNVVDATNYVMHELGQPLHAFDLATIGGGQIMVRTGTAGEAFTLLDGQTATLAATDLLICDATRPLVIAGVKGGLNSGVTEATTDLLLESACFDPATVRATKRRLDLHTDSAYRFERGTDPNATLAALDRVTQLIVELCGGTPTEATDVSAGPFAPAEVSLTYAYLDAIIGQPIAPDEVDDILTRLGIAVTRSGDALTCRVPRFKADVRGPQDIAEEVLRIYGMNQVPIPTKLNASLSFRPPSLEGRLDDRVADLLAGAGWREVWTNALTAHRHTPDAASPVRILNPLSEELDTLRTSLLPSALEVVAWNLNRQAQGLQLFEVGKVYATAADARAPYTEARRLMLVAAGATAPADWQRPTSAADLFTIKGAVHRLLQRLPLPPLAEQALADDAELAYGFALLHGKVALGRYGVVRADVAKRFDVTALVAYAELDLEALERLADQPAPTYAELPKAPLVRRDLAMFVPEGVSWAQIREVVMKSNPKLIREVVPFDVYRPKAGAAEARPSYALTLALQDPEQTLTDATVEGTMSRVMQLLEKELGVEIRRG